MSQKILQNEYETEVVVYINKSLKILKRYYKISLHSASINKNFRLHQKSLV